MITERTLIPPQPLWVRTLKTVPTRNAREEAVLRLQYRCDGELFGADGKLLFATLMIDAKLDPETNELQSLADGLESGSPLVPVFPRNGGATPKTVKVPDKDGNVYDAVALDTNGYPIPEADLAWKTQPISHWAIERLVPTHSGMGLALTGISVAPKKNPDTGELVYTANKETGSMVQWVYINCDADLVLVARPRMVATGTSKRSGAAAGGTGARVVRFAQ